MSGICRGFEGRMLIAGLFAVMIEDVFEIVPEAAVIRRCAEHVAGTEKCDDQCMITVFEFVAVLESVENHISLQR